MLAFLVSALVPSQLTAQTVWTCEKQQQRIYLNGQKMSKNNCALKYDYQQSLSSAGKAYKSYQLNSGPNLY